MKILINTSNLTVGGGVQVALSFIHELKNYSENKYCIIMSKCIEEQINQSTFLENFKFYLVDNSPSSIKTRSKVVSELNRIEIENTPDIIFSVFGPTYWKPKTTHIMGFALPWLINPNSTAFNQLSVLTLFKSRLRQKYNRFFVKRDASYYITETEDTKNKLSEIVKIDKDNIFVVGNTVNNVFNEDYERYPLDEKKDKEFRFLTISHNYPHKNLKVIKDVVNKLDNKNIKFFVTIDKDSYKALFNGLEESVINLGPVKIKDCPSIYEQCDALFLPTLLECFSASYPEAMKMKKPILTSNYSFAKDICGDAALFFNPLNPEDIISKINSITANETLKNKLIQNGLKRLKDFETAESRTKRYLDIFEDILKEQNEK